MESFSERMGLTSSTRLLQLDSIDRPLLNRLWNIYKLMVLDTLDPVYGRTALDSFRSFLWHNHFKENIDDSPYHYELFKRYLSDYFYSEPWYKIYNLIEFSSSFSRVDTNRYISSINTVLEEEYSGYRFIEGSVAPISNSIEKDTVEEAIKVTQYTFDGHANLHLQRALKFISDKPNPDYRNSVKESISAVGTVVRKITGKNSFGEGVKYLEHKGLKINSQLKEGLNKFYNYTNDPTTGIRHEIVDSPNPPDFETTKFMLLSCSAFINYIVPLAEKADIKILSK